MLHQIEAAQTSEERFLRQIFVRDQMAEWSKNAAAHGQGRRRLLLGRPRQALLDALSGIYTVSVGHNNRRVIEAIKKQLDTLHFSPPMHGTNPVAVQLANMIAEIAPGDLNTVKFECGGSEVTEAAIKLARQYHRLTGNPGKYKVISRYLSWHGSTLGALSASGLKGRKTVNEPLGPGLPARLPADLLPLPVRQERTRRARSPAPRSSNDVIEMEDPATVAAVMVEPIGHTGGIIDPPPEYLRILRDVCTRHNVLLDLRRDHHRHGPHRARCSRPRRSASCRT